MLPSTNPQQWLHGRDVVLLAELQNLKNLVKDTALCKKNLGTVKAGANYRCHHTVADVADVFDETSGTPAISGT